MPIFKSDGGAWNPVDKAAQDELKAKGVPYAGVKPKKTEDKTDKGVMAVGTTPKVAKSKLDGEKIAEPTPAQKARMAQKKR